MPVLYVPIVAGADDGFWDEADSSFDTSENSIFFGAYGRNAFLRFQDVGLPKNATIVDAYLSFTAWNSLTGTEVNIRISAVDADNPLAPTSYSEAENAARTTAYVDWNNVPAWTGMTEYEAEGLGPILEEITHRPGWEPGQAIIIYLEDNASSGWEMNINRRATSYEYGAAVTTLAILYDEYFVSDTLAMSETITLSDRLRYPEINESLSMAEALLIDLSHSSVEQISLSEAVRVDKAIAILEDMYLSDAVVPARGDWSVVRQHPHTTKLYMAVKKPRTIWTAIVANDRGYYESGNVEADQAIHVSGGADALVTPASWYMPDVTLWVGSAAGLKDRGVCRLKAFTSTTKLSVAADMSCVWKAGNYITVTDLHEYWPRFHKTNYDGSTVVVLKDNDLDSAHRVAEPVAIMGPPVCAFLDEITGTVDVNYDASDSYVIQPNSDEIYWATSKGISAYLWWFEGANTPIVFGPRATATYSTPGQYVVGLGLLGENGSSSVSYRNVFIFERSGANAPIEHFDIKELSGSQANHGWEGEIEVFGDYFSTTNLPNDAQVVIFAEETFAGDSQVVRLGLAGLHDRQNIKFVGWVTTTTLKYTSGRVRGATLTLKGLQHLLASKGNFPCYWSMVEAYAPAWSDLRPPEGLTTRKVWYYTIRYHWTLLNFTDCYIPDDHNNYLPGQSFSEGTLASWLDEFTNDTQANWCVDKGGALHIYSEPNWLPVPGYAPPTTTTDGTIVTGNDGAKWRQRLYTGIHLNDDDFIELTVDPRSRIEVARVRVEGVMGADNGWFATGVDMAPGDIRGLSGTTVTKSNQVLGTGGFYGSQGYELALMLFAEESRTIERINLTFAGNYSFFDIVPYSNWFTLSVAPPGGLRDVLWTNKPFWLTSMSITYDGINGDLFVTGEAAPETYPDFTLGIYSQFDDVGIMRQLYGNEGEVVLAGTLQKINEPDSTLIPALMGDGVGHIVGADVGTAIVRLQGDINSMMIVENKTYDPVDNRPVLVEMLKNAVGARVARIIATREPDDADADDPSKRARTIRHAVFCMPGYVSRSINTGTLAAPVYAITRFFMVGADMKSVTLRNVTAYCDFPATGTVGALSASIYDGGTVIGSIGLGGNAPATSTATLTGVLTMGDSLGIAITQSVRAQNLLVVIECVVYGI